MRKTNNSSKGKSFKTKDANKAFKKPSNKNSYTNDKPKRRFEESSDRNKKSTDDAPRPFKDSFERKPYKPYEGDRPRRTFTDSSERKSKPYSASKSNQNERPPRNFRGDKSESFINKTKPKQPSEFSDERNSFKRRPSKPFKKGGDSEARKYGPTKSLDKPSEGPVKKRFSKPRKGQEIDDQTKRVKFNDFEDGKVFSNAGKIDGHKPKIIFKKSNTNLKPQISDGLIRLNKYLSNAGIASRREADTLIQSGIVKVNGVVVDQLGYKINPTDKVTYGDAAVRSERKVYLLLNKPKDYITTVDDPQERKTVMELIAKVCKERVYPVGRLDRKTTGLLLFTNDGDITTKLTHPKFGVKKVYHVSLNKGLKPEDFKAITEGVELEDGIVKADDLAFVGEGKKEIGIEIHSGRNRIVRRLFEHLGYDILKLDRVVFAGLTKKDLPRGKHRFLTAKEISFLKMIG